MNNEMLREALFYDGVEIDIRTVKDDNAEQIKDIRNFIKEGVDLLVVAPNEAAPITPVVEEAFDRGIPVIVFDRKILSDKYTAYIGADNYELGKAIGNYVANMLHGQGNVVVIRDLLPPYLLIPAFSFWHVKMPVGCALRQERRWILFWRAFLK